MYYYVYIYIEREMYIITQLLTPNPISRCKISNSDVQRPKHRNRESRFLIVNILTTPQMPFCFFTTKFGDLLSKLGISKCFQPAMYTVFDEESESEIQNLQILQENLKDSISNFQIFYLLTRSGGYMHPLYSL